MFKTASELQEELDYLLAQHYQAGLGPETATLEREIARVESELIQTEGRDWSTQI